MKKIFIYAFAIFSVCSVMSCSNSTSYPKDGGEATVDVEAGDGAATDSVVSRGDGETFDNVSSGVKSVSSGPGENKPCHISGCSCKFGYAGNWDAKKCNKCGHSMSDHY